jgi:hypothetical protein
MHKELRLEMKICPYFVHTFLILFGNYRWTNAQNHKSIYLPYVLKVYGCETWYVALEEEQRPTAF